MLLYVIQQCFTEAALKTVTKSEFTQVHFDFSCYLYRYLINKNDGKKFKLEITNTNNKILSLTQEIAGSILVCSLAPVFSFTYI